MSSIRHISGGIHSRFLEAAQSLPLRHGQVVYGKLEKLLPNGLAAVKIGAESVVAELHAPLREGGRYWFQALLENGQILLKLIDQLDTGSGEAAAEKTARQLGQQWELPDEAQPLLRFLLQKQLPIVKEEVVQAARWLTAAKESDVPLRAVQMMYMNRLPLTESVFLAMKAVQEGQPLSAELAKLQEAIAQLPSGQQPESLRALSAHIKRIVEAEHALLRLLQQTGQANAAGEREHGGDVALEPFSEQGKTLRDTPLLSLNGANEEKGKARLRGEASVAASEAPEPSLPSGGERTGPLDGLMRKTSFEQAMPPDAHNEEATGAIAHHVKKLVALLGLEHEAALEQAFKNGRMLEMDRLKPLLLRASEDVPDGPLKEQIDNLVQRVTGQQLLSGEQGPMQSFFMQLPLRFGSGTADAVIHWQGRKQKNGKIDPHYCRILFYLQLEALQEVAMDVRIQNGVIHVTLFHDDPQLEALVPLMQPRLKERLAANGYMLSGIKVAPTAKKTNKDVFAHVLTHYSGVDYRI